MYPFAALIFLVIPVIEIFVLIQVGEIIGALWTISLVVLTAVIGVRLLKQQGLSTMMKAQQKMQAGAVPAGEMVEGIALIIAGAFLLTPGFFTDAIGFFLLIPATRKAAVALFAVKAADYIKNNAHSARNQQQGAHPFDQPQGPTQQSQGNIIEGVKYHKEED